MKDEYDYSDPYPSPDNIDFSRTHTMFRELVLFDDMFLNMQAMNIAMVDSFVTDLEYNLLRTYIDIERTPTQDALFVSAQSQMWIFALYELLRTWRSRIRALTRWKDAGALDQMLARLKEDRHNLGASMKARHIEQARDKDGFVALMKNQAASLEPVFRMTETIRINLAKHEVQGKPNLPVRAPGYGRINGLCGALDFELDTGDNTYEIINRRDIAEALRKVEVPS